MKKTIVFILISFSFILLHSCGGKEEKDCCKKDKQSHEEKSQPLSNESIFDLESKWVNQTKDSINLKDLSDKITIAAMVFTHCESACPRIVADIQRIEKAFTPFELSQIHFVLISMDPERDTPERFIEFSNEHQLNSNWICLSSSNDATMEIANVLNVRIKKLSNGGFDHSNMIHLINTNGNIVFQQNGLLQDPTEIIAKAKELVNKK